MLNRHGLCVSEAGRLRPDVVEQVDDEQPGAGCGA